MIRMGKHRLDRLTRIWTDEAAGEIITHYLKTEEPWGRDALLLLQVTGTDQSEEGLAVLENTADCLQRMLRQTDIAARVGEACFLVFLLGCHNEKDLTRIVEHVRQVLPAAGGYDIAAGGVITEGNSNTYEAILNRAKAGLCRARRGNTPLCILRGAEACREEEYDWSFEPVLPYERDHKKADMEFIRELMEFFYSGDQDEAAVEAGLHKICQYFGADVAYIIERKYGGKSYELSWNSKSGSQGVTNNNLKEIPSLIGDRFLELLEQQDVLVCSRIQDLERLDPIVAERQKLRGSQSMMQCLITESGEGVGYISMNDTRDRVWTRQEVETFYLASKVIAAQVLPIRFQRFSRILMDYDQLTEAWNYNRFLAEGKRRLRKSSLLQAVVTMDIKNFKVINSSFSFEIGNHVLVHISSLLSSFLGGGECFARIEADKFIILLEYQSMNGLLHRLNQLIRRIEQIPEDEKLDFDIRCIMGVCLVEPGDQDMSVLADHANAARKSQKDYHKSTYCFYNRESEQKILKEREMTFRMRGALENREFVVYYQPKISLEKQAFIGLEALVRWKTGEGKLIPPDEFIPLFEKNGFIVDLDRYVYERVCELIASWMQAGVTPVPIAVNISRLHLVEPDFLDGLTAINRKHHVPEAYLELEITESAFLHNPEMVLAVAKGIKEKGYVLTMDDFGTGYSSLCLLKDLPVDIIKLDREFFCKILNEREKIIVSNVIHMAKGLNIQVISEGIETDEHEQFLQEIGCDLAQGYRYGRPAPIEQYQSILFGESEEA